MRQKGGKMEEDIKYKIEEMNASGMSVRQISGVLGLDRSKVFRYIKELETASQKGSETESVSLENETKSVSNETDSVSNETKNETSETIKSFERQPDETLRAYRLRISKLYRPKTQDLFKSGKMDNPYGTEDLE